MIYFISYDICNPRRLRKTAKILEDYGIRIQYSFFECEMREEQKNILVNKILEVIDLKEDSFIIHPICEKCLKGVKKIGKGDIIQLDSYMII